jgi:hypothetical protein
MLITPGTAMFAGSSDARYFSCSPVVIDLEWITLLPPLARLRAPYSYLGVFYWRKLRRFVRTI